MRPAALFPTFPSVSCYQSAVVRTANEPTACLTYALILLWSEIVERGTHHIGKRERAAQGPDGGRALGLRGALPNVRHHLYRVSLLRGARPARGQAMNGGTPLGTGRNTDEWGGAMKSTGQRSLVGRVQ